MTDAAASDWPPICDDQQVISTALQIDAPYLWALITCICAHEILDGLLIGPLEGHIGLTLDGISLAKATGR